MHFEHCWYVMFCWTCTQIHVCAEMMQHKFRSSVAKRMDCIMRCMCSRWMRPWRGAQNEHKKSVTPVVISMDGYSLVIIIWAHCSCCPIYIITCKKHSVCAGIPADTSCLIWSRLSNSPRRLGFQRMSPLCAPDVTLAGDKNECMYADLLSLQRDLWCDIWVSNAVFLLKTINQLIIASW